MYGEYSLGTPQEFQWLVDNGLLEMIINEGKTFFELIGIRLQEKMPEVW
jgi:hypothetical protein